MAKTKYISVSVSLWPDDLRYIERAGEGNNLSKRMRSLVREHRAAREGLAVYAEDGTIVSHDKEATIIFERRDEETLWADKLPFPYNKKQGHSGLASAASEHGFRCQVYEQKETGYIAVWIAKAARGRCVECKAKLMKVLEAL